MVKYHMIVKALSLKQPWANLIAEGTKTIETRSWKSSYRGDILICSSKNPRVEPYGKALCIVELCHIEPMKKEHETAACYEIFPDAQAWFIRNIRILKNQFEVKGQLNIFNLDVGDNEEVISLWKTQ